MNCLSEIEEDVFGTYNIKVVSGNTYKVYKRKDCVKLDVYKSLKSNDISISDEDINKYYTLASTHNTLFHAIIYIAEANILFDQSRIIGFFKVITEFKNYVTILK